MQAYLFWDTCHKSFSIWPLVLWWINVSRSSNVPEQCRTSFQDKWFRLSRNLSSTWCFIQQLWECVSPGVLPPHPSWYLKKDNLMWIVGQVFFPHSVKSRSYKKSTFLIRECNYFIKSSLCTWDPEKTVQWEHMIKDELMEKYI